MARSLHHDDYTIGWICAISVEFQAAISMLDERHNGEFPILPGGNTVYTAGRIGGHKIVIARLPEQKTGNVASAGLMTQMKMSFRNLRFSFMVGIGAGVPGTNGCDPDVRLGDVVVAFPTDKSSGIVGYELGKETVEGFLKRQDNSYRMDPLLQSTISLIKDQSEVDEINGFLEHLNLPTPPGLGKRKYGQETPSQTRSKLIHPIRNGYTDILYSIDTGEVVVRPPRRTGEDPVVHFGAIASGDKVVKSARQRDNLRDKYNILCIEMEAAGLRDSYPAAIIRGISDYADNHKNDHWQPYAAVVASAYAKEVILRLPPTLEDQRLEDIEASSQNRGNMTTQVPTDVPKEGVKFDKEDRRACLESLSFEQIDARLTDIKKAHSKTCQWLYKQKEYRNWLNKGLLEEHHGFLWIKGKPGAGKSTIMKHAFHSKTMLDEAIAVSFFFNARGPSVLEKSVLGMYRSLVHQILLAIPSLQDELVPIYLKKRKAHDFIDWLTTELQEFLEKVIDRLQTHQHLVFFIDALDECESEEIRDMVEFFQSLGETAVSQERSLSICFASRHYPHISISHCVELIVENQEGHENDIERYVKNNFKAQKGKPMDKVRAEILRKASGVFLWVVLVVNILKKECDAGMTHRISKKLDEIPAELDELFADILSRGNSPGIETTLCMQWLLFSKRPLKSEEFYFAILFGFEPGATKDWDVEDKDSNDETVKRFILSCSKGLAEISKRKDRTVQFIHETVRDFFLLRNGLATMEPTLQANVAGSSEDQLKRCCYECIKTDQFDDIFRKRLPKAKSDKMKDLQKKSLDQVPFLEYATQNVFKHADSAQENGFSQASFLAEFDTPEIPRFRNWKNINNLIEKHNIRRYSPEVNFLYVLTEQNLPNLVEVLIPSLQIADIDAIGGRYESAIYAAFSHCHGKIFQLLINAGANLNLSMARESALSLEQVEILAQNGMGIKEKFKDKMTMLHYASQFGLTHMVKKILESPGAEIEIYDRYGQTPMFFAVAGGHEAVTRLLLDKGADVNARCSLCAGRPTDPLHEASAAGHDRIVHLLLEKGAQINVQCGLPSGVALHIASYKGFDKVVQILLENGADANAQDYGEMCSNALQAASYYGHIEVVRILLDNGADVNSQGGYHGNALQAASYSGSPEVVRMLLDNGADINAQGGDYGNALQAASYRGHIEVVQMLLDNGAGINAQGGCYGNALMAALSSFHKDRGVVIQLLREAGAIEKCSEQANEVRESHNDTAIPDTRRLHGLSAPNLSDEVPVGHRSPYQPHQSSDGNSKSGFIDPSDVVHDESGSYYNPILL